MALAPDGTLVFADSGRPFVWRLQTPVGIGSSSGFLIADADGQKAFTFDTNGRHLTTVNAITKAVLYSFSYDSQTGNLIGIKDVNGDTTVIQYDLDGLPMAILSPLGPVTGLTVDGKGYLNSIQDPVGNTYAYQYDANGLLQKTTTPRTFASNYTYEPTTGRLKTDTDAVGGGASLSNTFTTTGNIVTRTTAMGVASSYELDPLSSGDTQQVVTGSNNLVTSITLGRDGSYSTTSPNGTKTSFTPSADPRFGPQAPMAFPYTMTTPAGLARSITVTRSVALSNPSDLLSVQSAMLTGAINGNTNTWTSQFNAMQNTITMTSPMGRTINETLDARGNITQLSIPNLTPSFTPISLTYDGHGRLQAISQGTFAQGSQQLTRQWTLGYDSNGYFSSATDPMSNVVSYQNDDAGRTHDTLLPDGGASGTRDLKTGFDPDDNLMSITLPRTSAGTELHQLNYTPVDLLSTYTPPSPAAGGWATTYQYDLDRRLHVETRPDGATIMPDYDSAGRLWHVTYPQGVITRTYDASLGALRTVATPGGETLAFDFDGPLLTALTWSGTVAGSVGFGYDSSFRMTSQSVDSNALSFGYDNDDLLTTAGAITLARDPQIGRLTGTSLGSVGDTIGYDTNGLFGAYTAAFGGSTVYQESIVSRDGDQRITERTEAVNGVSHDWIYAYDTAGRLTGVTKDSSVVAQFGYDADDNRTSATIAGTTVNPTYDIQDRLLTYGSAIYTYGANGELETKTVGSQVTNYTYDVFGNLLHVMLPSGTSIDYVVDGLNRRVGKKVNNILTTGFLYKDQLKPVAQLDGSTPGNVVARFVYGSNGNVPDYMTTSAGTFRILTDHLGSPRMVVDTSTGAVVEQIDYDVFGNVVADTNPAFQPFGFGGGLYDKDTGLVRFGARDYDPTIGRWTSKDPIRFDGTFNLYGYAQNDPVNHIDPNGEDLGDCAIGLGQEAAACLAAGLDPLLIPACIAAEQNAVQACGSGLGGGPGPSPTPTPPGPPTPPPTCGGVDAWKGGSCSCQHRDIFRSGGKSCQQLREEGTCAGPYKGTGADSASCQRNARDNAPAACKGCLGHCLFMGQ